MTYADQVVVAVIAVAIQRLPIAGTLHFAQATMVVVHQLVALFVVLQVAFGIVLERLADRVIRLQGVLCLFQDEAVVYVKGLVPCAIGKIGVALSQVVQLVVDKKLTLDGPASRVARQAGAFAGVLLQLVECIVVEGFQQHLLVVTGDGAGTQLVIFLPRQCDALGEGGAIVAGECLFATFLSA
ncbi:hypothetical protein D3C81_1148970 [compost metagenome]